MAGGAGIIWRYCIVQKVALCVLYNLERDGAHKFAYMRR